MKSVKDLQKAADLERQKAEAERNAAQTHRDTASGYSLKDDPRVPMKENQEAQSADERAQEHEKAANALMQEATTIQEQTVAIEREKQEKQQRLQDEIDQLDAQAKSLRGE